MTEEPTRREPDPVTRSAANDEEILALGRQLYEHSIATARPTADLTPWEQLRHQDYLQDIILRRTYARWMLLILAGELVFVNALFALYTWKNEWDVTGRTMEVWLGSTVVQIIGVVYVVTRYLFPRRDHDDR
jgi:hypothetical protein